MKKGFTLLELLIVIIIIGVLAVVALTQYRNLSERARMSEAKSVIGAIRTAERIYHEDQGSFTPTLADLDAYIDVPPSSPCETSHWFGYTLSAATGGAAGGTDSFTVRATRCSGLGKSPDIAVGDVYYMQLQEYGNGTQVKETNVGGTVVPNW